MALTTTGINYVSGILDYIEKSKNSLPEMQEMITFMDSDSNFTEFISGTTFGKDSYEKWRKLITLMTNDLYDTLTTMCNATRDYLEIQKAYNDKGAEGYAPSHPANASNIVNFKN